MKLPKGKFTVYSLKFMVGFLALLFTVHCSLSTTKAFDVASTYSVADRSAVSGDILSEDPQKGLVRSSITYDGHLFGVLSDEPIAVYRNKDATASATANDQPVIRNGDTIVNVTDYGGSINQGDYITSSPISGKGMKATQTGYVIGIATSAVTPGEKVTFQGKQYTSGTISVALRIEYAEISTPRSTNSLLSALNSAFFRSVQNPEQFTLVIRYIIAGLISILSLVLGFLSFSRSVAKGIEAIGRNPLAKTAIQINIGVQVFLTILTTAAAVVLAIVIIRL